MVLVRLKIINYAVKILKPITLKLLKLQAQYTTDNIALKRSKFDLRKIPKYLKRFIIHDEVVLARRWNLCKGCEFLTKNNRCMKCGCFMSFKHRLSLARCPIGKWEKEKSVDSIKAIPR